MFLLFFVIELIILYFLAKTLTKTISQSLHNITRNQKITIILFAILFFPGTLIHELAHFMVAAALFVKVGDINLLPKVTYNNVILGSVQIAKTDPFRRFLIGAAPIIVGIFIIATIIVIIPQISHFPTILQILLIGYTVFVIGNTMFSSKRDMEGAIELFIIVGSIYFALSLFGVSISQKWLDDMLNLIEPYLQTISFYLLIPIIIDIVIIFPLKILHFLASNQRYKH